MKNFILLSAILIAVITANAQWTQIGNDIDGVEYSDNSGHSVSISEDGTIVAIGSPYHDGNTGNNLDNRGCVRIYNNIGGNWTQVGSDIVGDANNDKFGLSVSLNSDGTIVAIGAECGGIPVTCDGYVRVFEYNGVDWVQLGNDIEGEQIYSYFGHSVSLNYDGSVVAIGSPTYSIASYEEGRTKVFSYNGTDWIQIGSNIDGEHVSDRCGNEVSLDSSGTILAVTSSDTLTGFVRIFNFNGTNWTQIGNTIYGEGNFDVFGLATDFNNDGTLLAIGGRGNDGNGENSGHARVYQYNGTSWIKLGSDIDGEAAGDYFGTSISISSNGSIVAIGAYHNGNVAGHVRVFEYNGSNWVQLGNDIDGEAPWDNSGWSVDISSNGSIVAIGAPHNHGNDTIISYRGHVRVYGIATSVKENTTNTEVSIYPNPTTGIIRINNEKLIINNVEVFDIYGKEVFYNKVKSQKTNIKSKNCEIDLSNQAKGIYIIKVTTAKAVVIEKIIKN